MEVSDCWEVWGRSRRLTFGCLGRAMVLDFGRLLEKTRRFLKAKSAPLLGMGGESKFRLDKWCGDT